MQGFFGGSTPKQGEIGNPYDTADAEGTDFLRIFQLRSLDFAMYHMHVDEWVDGGSFEEKVEAMNKWIDTHVNMTTHLLKKPLMLSEYSLVLAPYPSHAFFFWFGTQFYDAPYLCRAESRRLFPSERISCNACTISSSRTLSRETLLLVET